jgi:hypothetical protein
MCVRACAVCVCVPVSVCLRARVRVCACVCLCGGVGRGRANIRTLLGAGGHMHKDAHAREETSFQHRMQAWQHAQELEKNEKRKKRSPSSVGPRFFPP